MSSHAQPAREENVKAIADYYSSGIKKDTERIGIELEHTLSHADGSQVSYKDDDFGVHDLLNELSDAYSEMVLEGDALIGLAREGETITLEPAAQVELSAGPFSTLDDASKRLSAFEDLLRHTCETHDISVQTPGYNLHQRAIDLKLIPKKRYEMMNEYLGAISMYGVCMMRGSASTQISIDYSSVADCLRKMRLANACVPLFSLMSDNAPIFEGRPREHQLVRTKIWQKCDPQRCGIVPGVMDSAFTFESYASYILDTPAIVDKRNGQEHFSTKTFGEIFANQPMNRADVEHAISMFFNDVRLKTYIEIRPADALPLRFVLAYAALIKGLFYGEGSLDALETIFGNVTEPMIEEAKNALMAAGYQARVYDVPASELADELISIATTGLSGHERTYLEPLASLVSERTTLACLAEQI